jgi:hypothetical protein
LPRLGVEASALLVHPAAEGGHGRGERVDAIRERRQLLLGLRGLLARSCTGGRVFPFAGCLKPLDGDLQPRQLRSHLHHLSLGGGAGDVSHAGAATEEEGDGEAEPKGPPRRQVDLYCALTRK